MTRLTLKSKPSLRDFQAYVRRMKKARGFEKETVPEMFQLFLEECGEMAKAARKTSGMKTDKRSETHDLGHEIADVFIYLLAFCNTFGIDLERAFREKGRDK